MNFSMVVRIGRASGASLLVGFRSFDAENQSYKYNIPVRLGGNFSPDNSLFNPALDDISTKH
jgi:hypothetical protein